MLASEFVIDFLRFRLIFPFRRQHKRRSAFFTRKKENSSQLMKKEEFKPDETARYLFAHYFSETFAVL